jgi:hypothetical protein
MEATLSGPATVKAEPRRFFVWTAALFVLIAFGGFTPSYWAPVAHGAFRMPPIAHIHGIVLFSWTLFYFAQTTWVASGRTERHRAWGLAGIALFSVMVCTIIALKITMLRVDDANGFGDAGRRFSAIAFGALPVMITGFALAIANVRRPEIHKRLMYVLMSAMMVPAIARVFLAVLAPAGAAAGGPPPAFVATPPTLVASLLIVAAIIHDRRTRGSAHPVYVWGLVAVIASNAVSVLGAGTDAWMNTARYLQSLGG